MKMTLGAFEPLVLCDGGGAGVKGTGSFSERRRRPPSPTPRADPARMEYFDEAPTGYLCGHADLSDLYLRICLILILSLFAGRLMSSPSTPSVIGPL